MADLTGRMIGAMQADVKTFTEIEADPGAMSQAVTVIVIAGVASLIGNFFRAGVAAGIDGVFMEVHQDPPKAKSDAQNALKLDLLPALLDKLVQIHHVRTRDAVAT